MVTSLQRSSTGQLQLGEYNVIITDRDDDHKQDPNLTKLKG